MKRALNKGVKKYVKLLWGKRSKPDVATAGYPAFFAGALCRLPGQHQFGPGPTAARNVAPSGVL